MDYGRFVMDHLIASYNASKHRKGEAKVNRKVKFPFSPQKFPDYHLDGLQNSREFINVEIKKLQVLGLIKIEWMEKDFLIESISLNIERIDEAYQYLGRSSLNDAIEKRVHSFSEFSFAVTLPWIKVFVDHMLLVLRNKEMPPIAQDEASLQMLFCCLKGIEAKGKEVIPERLFSKRYLGDSKIYEKQLRARILSIYKTYAYRNNPTVIGWEDEDYLQELGIVKSVEEMYIKGDLLYETSGRRMNFGDFPFGTSINSLTIREGRISEVRNRELLIIENKTVFREYIKQNQEKDELVVYVGGFPGPDKRSFFDQLYKWNTQHRLSDFIYRFWGDIDLGGFRIYSHLKSTVLPQLIPYQMDDSVFLKYLDRAEPAEEAYLKKLEKLQGDLRFEEFNSLIQLMLKHRKRLEQEELLI